MLHCFWRRKENIKILELRSLVGIAAAAGSNLTLSWMSLWFGSLSSTMEQPIGPGESYNPSATLANYNIVVSVCHLMDVSFPGDLKIAMHQNLEDGIVFELCKNVLACFSKGRSKIMYCFVLNY